MSATDARIVDARRKLSPDDYSKMRLYLSMDYTIREVASTFGVSTKYVKRINAGEFTFANDGSVSFTTAPDSVVPQPPILDTCSGCGLAFGQSGLQSHWSIYTSGFTKELECGALIGR